MIVLKQKRNLTKCFYSPQDREKVFQILEAPPGSGKTYTSLLHSIELAKKGYVIIFTFPNKNLLEVNFREAIKLSNNDDDNEQKISIHQHYMEAYIHIVIFLIFFYQVLQLSLLCMFICLIEGIFFNIQLYSFLQKRSQLKLSSLSTKHTNTLTNFKKITKFHLQRCLLWIEEKLFFH